MRTSTKIYYLLPVLFFLLGCQQKKQPPTLFQLQENTGITFSNDVHNTKDFNIFTYRNFYNGGGVAIGDINNDGLADILFTANMGSNKLYLNKGNWKFEDITDKAGFTNDGKWGTGVVLVDINNDGWLDIYVCNAGYQKGVSNENELYINNHNLTFTESAAQYGLNETGYTTHAAFFDYDLDGDLDCYILKNSFIPVNTLNYANKRELRAKDWPVADFLKGGGDKLLRNDKGKFVDVSQQANIYGSLIGFGLGVTVGDVNGDGYPDIYISNDFFERDYLYINQKNGTYQEELEQWMQHISGSSMGADIGDVNNDGYPDIFTTDMLPDNDYRLKTTSSFENIDVKRLKQSSGFYNQFMQNTLQVNNKSGKFMETAYYSGVAASDWSWGGLIFDADNDGLADIYVCNGIYHDVTDQDFIDFFANDVIQHMAMTGEKQAVENIISKMPSQPVVNKAFKNKGHLKFSDEGMAWGFTQPSFSNGAAYGDLDNDGDLDVVVNNVNAPAFVYKNNSREQLKNNFIGLLLKGRGSNTFAIGSTIKLYIGDQVISREVMPSRGFQSSVDYKVIAGIGQAAAIDSMVILWPDRSSTTMLHPAINKVHQVQQPEKAGTFVPAPAVAATLLQPIGQPFEKHKEDEYVDFYYERGVPMMLSREGPKAACGDVNGDGKTDVYIGGAAGQSGQLYLQTASGFVQKKENVFDRFASFEDVAVLFFDCDNDGDLDLFVGSGGNNHPVGSVEMQSRLYKNDGHGNFEISPDAFPNNGMNTAVAIANDFDGDGDLDLFVGSRSVPQSYGLAPQSYLYVNDGHGKFTDMAAAKNPNISHAGMITGAAWADVTGDGRKELIVTGEWMTPKIFSFTGDRFTEVATNLSQLQGWWQTLSISDLDGDGKEDIILGNVGENFYLQADSAHPVKLWINDFDNNGTEEKIITRTVAGKDKPVFLKRDLVDQIASLRKQNLKYVDFANKSIQELFPAAVMKKSRMMPFTYAASCIAWNEGNGKFSVQKLPVAMQLSCMNALLCTDINGDGLTDIIAGGNKFEWLPQFSSLDASFGSVLINKGKRQFMSLLPGESGVQLRGEIRDIVALPVNNKNCLLFLQNNDYPVLYQLKKEPASIVKK